MGGAGDIDSRTEVAGMEAPPLVGDPYQFTNYQGTNEGQNGVIVGWDSVRYFWGTVAQEGVTDLQNIVAGGGTLA